jgi:hypothetical protein
MNWLKHKKEFPKESHFVIIEFSQISQPGYDPGDPPDRIPYIDYIFFTNEEEWKKEIENKTLNKFGNDFVAFKANPVSIQTSVNVTIKE